MVGMHGDDVPEVATLKNYFKTQTSHVFVSCPFKEETDLHGKKVTYQEFIQWLCRHSLDKFNAVVDGQVSEFAKTTEKNWLPAWLASVWKVVENIPPSHRIVLVLVNGGGKGCINERETIPTLIETIQKKLYPAGRMADMVVGTLPQVGYKVVDMADLKENGVEKARCLMKGEGDGIIGGETGGGDDMEFDAALQAYKTTYLDFMKFDGLTDEDVEHVGKLLADDDKFEKIE